MAAETILELPFEYNNNFVGFSLDAGGSVTKVLYRSKEDYEHGVSREARDKLKLRSAHLPRDNPDALIDFLQKNCDVIARDDSHPAYITGVGGQRISKCLTEMFKVRIKILSETECFIKAVTTLCQAFPLEQLYYPVEGQNFKLALTIIRQFEKMMKHADRPDCTIAEVTESAEKSLASNKKTSALDPQFLAKEYNSKPITWPVLMVIGGSAFSCTKVHEDCRSEFADFTTRGGRMLLGLSKLVLGTQDFHEIADMASRGDHRKVNSQIEDNFRDTGETEASMYSVSVEGFPMYSFGRVIDRSFDGTYSKEDLAACLIFTLMLDLVQFVELNAVRRDIRCVLFCGSIFSHITVRSMLNEAMLARCVPNRVPPEKKVYFKLLRHCGHMGAIGCWMEAVQRAAQDHANECTNEDA